jgi:hypothetical protein
MAHDAKQRDSPAALALGLIRLPGSYATRLTMYADVIGELLSAYFSTSKEAPLQSRSLHLTQLVDCTFEAVSTILSFFSKCVLVNIKQK